jgi:hypothetical protein
VAFSKAGEWRQTLGDMKAYCKIHRGTKNNLRIFALFDELRKKREKRREKKFSLNGISLRIF